jgi:hypothetical protein
LLTRFTRAKYAREESGNFTPGKIDRRTNMDPNIRLPVWMSTEHQRAATMSVDDHSIAFLTKIERRINTGDYNRNLQ